MSNGTAAEKHWEKIRSELEEQVLLRVAEMPRSPLQYWMLAFNLACGENFESMLFGKEEYSAKLRKNVTQMTTGDLQHIYSCVYLAFMGMIKDRYELETWEHMIGAVQVLYSQPKSTIARWAEFIIEYENDDSFYGRIPFRLNDEITPILGLYKNDPVLAAGWPHLLKYVVKDTQDNYDNPGWIDACDGDMWNTESAVARRGVQPSGCMVALLAMLFSITAPLSAVYALAEFNQTTPHFSTNRQHRSDDSPTDKQIDFEGMTAPDLPAGSASGAGSDSRGSPLVGL